MISSCSILSPHLCLVTSNLTLPPQEARRFQCEAVALGRTWGTVGEALAHLGYVQMDPINVCGRMQDLILRHRVAGYREDDLFRHLHGAGREPLPGDVRTAFEHHLPGTGVLVTLPVASWPFLLATMRERSLRDSTWSGRLTAPEEKLAKRLLSEIQERGALSSDDLDDGQRTHHGWGSQTSLARATLQKLFFHGRLLIARREGVRRYYDLPERALPAAILNAPEPDVAAVHRWRVLLRLRQRRLVTLNRADHAVVEDLVSPLQVNLPTPKVWYALKSDLPILNQPPQERPPLLLAPLDPLIYDRAQTRALWDYDYTWEVYTPPEKRVRGYYALPLLSGLELAGRVDPKADRRTGKLEVVGRAVRRGHRTAGAVRELAQFLGLKT